MKYGFKTYWMKVDDHKFFVVESTELDGCVAQGDTPQEALKQFEENEIEWLLTAEKYNIPIPKEKIMEQQEFSGKLLLRLSKTLHSSIAKLAQEDEISINSFISNSLSEKLGYRQAYNDFEKANSKQTEIISNAVKILSNNSKLSDFSINKNYNYKSGGYKNAKNVAFN